MKQSFKGGGIKSREITPRKKIFETIDYVETNKKVLAKKKMSTNRVKKKNSTFSTQVHKIKDK